MNAIDNRPKNGLKMIVISKPFGSHFRCEPSAKTESRSGKNVHSLPLSPCLRFRSLCGVASRRCAPRAETLCHRFGSSIMAVRLHGPRGGYRPIPRRYFELYLSIWLVSVIKIHGSGQTAEAFPLFAALSLSFGLIWTLLAGQTQAEKMYLA